jgi:hypothetical protein
MAFDFSRTMCFSQKGDYYMFLVWNPVMQILRKIHGQLMRLKTDDVPLGFLRQLVKILLYLLSHIRHDFFLTKGRKLKQWNNKPAQRQQQPNSHR